MDFLRRRALTFWRPADSEAAPPAATVDDGSTAKPPPPPARTRTVVTDDRHTVTLAVRESVPPVPDASLLYESVLLERDPFYAVEVRAGVRVTAARVSESASAVGSEWTLNG